jgi:hypothetical protein
MHLVRGATGLLQWSIAKHEQLLHLDHTVKFMHSIDLSGIDQRDLELRAVSFSTFLLNPTKWNIVIRGKYGCAICVVMDLRCKRLVPIMVVALLQEPHNMIGLISAMTRLHPMRTEISRLNAS